MEDAHHLHKTDAIATLPRMTLGLDVSTILGAMLQGHYKARNWPNIPENFYQQLFHHENTICNAKDSITRVSWAKVGEVNIFLSACHGETDYDTQK